MDNKIEVLPDGLPVLKNLGICALSRNRIKVLPSSLARMNKLRMLDVTKNPIVYPPKEAWAFDITEDPDTRISKDSYMDRDKRGAETYKIITYLRGDLVKQKIRSNMSETEQRYARAPLYHMSRG